MKLFIEMLDSVTERGLLIPPKVSEGFVDDLKLLERDFLSAASKARVFVFLPKYEVPQELPPVQETIEACPFPIFSIEMSGSAPITVGKFDSSGEQVVVDTYCLLCIETKPAVYSIWAYMKSGVYSGVTPVGREFYGIVQDFVNRVNKERSGLERVNVKLRVGSGSSRGRVEIRNVIHISEHVPKEYSSYGSRDVDWSHRFEVRGHWRKVDTIGKDREGNYCVEGWTWVREHVRGPEHLPIVKKQRIVHSS